MSDELLSEIKQIIKKHDDKEFKTKLESYYNSGNAIQAEESPVIERWIPICSGYKESSRLRLYKEKGGSNTGEKPDPVLAWVKVRIDPTKPMGIEILEYCKLPN